MKAQLLLAHRVVQQELAAGATQLTVARTYALALRTNHEGTDWKAVNEAVLGRWQPSGLEQVKRAAWEAVECGHLPTACMHCGLSSLRGLHHVQQAGGWVHSGTCLTELHAEAQR